MVSISTELGKVLERTRSPRFGALGGLAFAACFFAGVAMLEIPQGARDQDLVSWWADRGNQASAVVSMYLFVAAGLAFLVLLVTLRSRLLVAEGGEGVLAGIVFASGVVFVAMLFVAAAARGVIGFAALSPANGERPPGPDTLRYLPELGYTVTSTGGMLAAALTMAAASCLIVRTAVFGRWLAWIGALAGLAVLGATLALSAVFAIPALLAWAVATSVALWGGAPPTCGNRKGGGQ